MKYFCALVGWLALTLWANLASAQPAPAENAIEVVKSLQTGTRHADGRGTPKLLIPTSSAPAMAANPEAAYEYLLTHRNELRLSADRSDLQLVSARESLVGTHYRFRQMLNGVPVEGADVVVSVGRTDHEIYQVYNNAYPVAAKPALQKNQIGADQAIDAAWKHLRVHGKLLDNLRAELVYIPTDAGFRLVYKTLVAVEAPFGYWEHQIDAVSGVVVAVRDTVIDEMMDGGKPRDFAAYAGPVWSKLQAVLEWDSTQTLQKQTSGIRKNTVDGTAQVFDGDPRTFLADASLVDSSPASAFSGAYVLRTLRDISEDGGVYSLDGPWVVITDFESPTAAPSTTTNGQWTATRGDNAFNDAMSYFHIDQNQRYLQSLGYTGATGIQNRPIQVDSHGVNGEDQSHYVTSTNRLAFGHGKVDDNEDADVILHEYGHALTHDIVPTWGGGDAGAIGEGFGDYWGASYSSTTVNGESFHPEWAFSWDGHSADSWAGRFLDKVSLTYDPNQTYTAHRAILGISNYSDQLWSTPLFQSFLTLRGMGYARTDMDKIVVESFFGVGGNPTMRDLAISTVVAAARLFPSGPHAGVYREKFSAQNILNNASEATIAAHVVGPTTIDLAWLKNVAGDDVMIAWNTSNTFGTPSGQYAVGAAIPGGGAILFNGSGTTVSHAGLAVGTRYYYKAWSVSAGPTYSAGVVVSTWTPPANDMFASRLTIAGTSATVSGNNFSATRETGEPNHAGQPGGGSVWWSWTAPSAGLVSINTAGSSFDTLLAAYTGTAVGTLAAVASNDDGSSSILTSAISFTATSGVTYQIVVDGFNKANGTIALALTFTVPPVNDNFAQRTVLTGPSTTATGTNIGATTEAGEPSFSSRRSVWWSWNAPTSGLVTISTEGSNFDTLLGVYVGTAVTSLTTVASDDDSGVGTTSLVTFSASAATTYQIAVASFGSSSGSVSLSLELGSDVPPTIDTQPQAQSVTTGNSATFTVAASGTPAPAYQWQRLPSGSATWGNLANGGGYSGVTTTTLTVSATTTSMSGDQFRCVVSNGVSPDATTNAATLTVNTLSVAPASPALFLDGVNDVVRAATSVYPNSSTLHSYTVEAWIHPTRYPSTEAFIATDDAWDLKIVYTGGAANGGLGIGLILWGPGGSRQSMVEYRDVRLNQWNHVAAIYDATAGTVVIAINGVLSNSPSTYFGTGFFVDANFPCTIGGFSPTSSSGFFAGYIDEVRISDTVRYPANFTPSTILAADANTRALWHFSESPGATSFADSSGNSFTLTAHNGVQTAVSPGADAAPTITTQPASQTVTAGGCVELSVTASGSGPFTYQWRRNGVDIAGATSNTCTVPSSQRFHAGSYTVVVSANGLSSVSAPAIVTIDVPAPSNARVLNLSTRGLAQAGDNVLIPGFVISGGGTKKLLIRAVGPTLGKPPFGIPGVLPNPRMRLLRRNTTTQLFEQIAANDDWATNANAAEITRTATDLFAFAFNDALEAALLMDLAPGEYTVNAGDANDASGIAIVELYDADAGTPGSRLINISNRGFVGVGDQVMIPGFVVSSEGPKTLLVRVVGPTLGSFGVPGTMADPKLTVYSGQTAILENDNWSENPDANNTAQIAQQVFAFPLNAGSKDAAFVVTLQPGSYTVVGSSAGGAGTGVVLVEVYVVP